MCITTNMNCISKAVLPLFNTISACTHPSTPADHLHTCLLLCKLLIGKPTRCSANGWCFLGVVTGAHIPIELCLKRTILEQLCGISTQGVLQRRHTNTTTKMSHKHINKDITQTQQQRHHTNTTTKTSHKHSKKDVTQVQQQRPELPIVTHLTWE